jgi:hypothetical protein
VNGSSIFFLVFSGIIALVGLLAAGMAHDYLQFFGFALFLFGLLFGFSCIKRHFDAQEAARH